MQSEAEIGVIVDAKQARTGVRRRVRKICANAMGIYGAEFAKVRRMSKKAEQELAEAKDIQAEVRRLLDDIRALHTEIFGGASSPNQVKH